MKINILGKEFEIKVQQLTPDAIGGTFNKQDFSLSPSESLYVTLHVRVELDSFKTINDKAFNILISEYGLFKIEYERGPYVDFSLQVFTYDYQNLKTLRGSYKLENKVTTVLKDLMKTFRLSVAKFDLSYEYKVRSFRNLVGVEAYAETFNVFTSNIFPKQYILKTFWDFVENKPYIHKFTLKSPADTKLYASYLRMLKNDIIVCFSRTTLLPVEKLITNYILPDHLGKPIRRVLDVCLINNQIHLSDSNNCIIYHSLELTSLDELKLVPLLAYVDDTVVKKLSSLTDLACLFI